MSIEQKSVVITSAVRTAIGKFRGSLKNMQGHELGSVVIKESIKRSNLKLNDVDELIMGQVLTGAAGQNPARQAAIHAGLPINKTAYVINQVCEFLKGPIEELSGEKVTMCILSNLVDTKLTVAEVELRDVDAETGEKIEEASIFAEYDPYRAATNNKGVLNGIDPILIATGNDWRAVEAGIHAYAGRDGQYRSITRWRYKGGGIKYCVRADERAKDGKLAVSINS